MGTVNLIFRIGDELYARLPRKPAWADDLKYKSHLLPTLAFAVAACHPGADREGSSYPALSMAGGDLSLDRGRALHR